MTKNEGYLLGDELKTLVGVRTGLKGSDLVCPREKSSMTPCIARDGGMCVVFTSWHDPICVGCEARLEPLVEAERLKAKPAPGITSA